MHITGKKTVQVAKINLKSLVVKRWKKMEKNAQAVIAKKRKLNLNQIKIE